MSKKQPIKKNPPAPPQAKQVADKLENKPGDKAPFGGLSTVKVLCLLLSAITFVLYINTLHNGFVLDDVIMVKENTIVAKGFGGITELLTTPHMRGYLIIPNDTYRPLSLVMFAIEYGFFGLNPAVNHFFNVVVFAGCVVLLFLFLNKFFEGKKPLAAFIGAFLFAVHPVHTEVVANIKSRDELLCFLFAFLSLNIFMNYMREAKMTQLLLGTFTLFLAFISKENVITFLGVIPLFFFFYKNESKQRAMFISGGAIAAAAAFIIIRAIILKEYHANETAQIEFIDNALTKAPNIASRIATSVHISGKYLWLLFIPYPLICNYSYNAIPFSTFADISTLAALAAYAAMIYFAVSRFIKDKKDPFAFAIFYYLMTIALFNNMFILIGAEMGERFLFMASAGWCIAAAAVADKWLIKTNTEDINQLKSPKILAICIPALLVFGGMTFARNRDWNGNVNLYRIDLEKSPNDSRLNYYLGTALAETLYMEEPDTSKRKEIDKEALSHIRQALAIYPDFSEANAEAGRIFDRQMRYDSAEYYDRRALQLNPNHPVATNNLGSIFLETGQYRLAIQTFKRALEINPNFVLAYFNMARTYVALKQFDSGIYCYHKMLELNPGYSDAYMEIGTTFFSLEKYDSSAVYFKKVLSMQPDNANAINNLGAGYLNSKNYPAAIEQFKRSLQLNANSVNTYSNLGRAYFFTNQYELCIQTFTKQLSIDNKQVVNIPYIALSYQKLGNMQEARKYEAISKQYFSDFKLP